MDEVDLFERVADGGLYAPASGSDGLHVATVRAMLQHAAVSPALGRRKVFVIEKAFVVCGKVPRPNVFYVLQASNINYEWETLKQDFLPKVIDSVRKAPF